MSVVFIRSIIAIILSVADHRVDDATRVVALEVVFAAVDLAAGRRLVRPVFAVFSAVTMPRPRDADTRSGAVELFLLVALVGR